MTLITIATLALSVLGRSLPDHRLPICIIVSVGGILLAVQALFTRKLIWALVFLGVVGVFTPFQSAQFSHALVPILDMATLVLFAVSPFMFSSSPIPVAIVPLHGSAAAMTTRPPARIHRS
jgi:hypothetical protein